MSEFQRSPSKVWWAEESSLSWRAQSESPGSQDSGFSDTETSPNARKKSSSATTSTTKSDITPEKQLNKALAKSNSTPKSKNLTSEIIEKTTPEKSTLLLQGLITPGKVYYLPNTPTKPDDKIRKAQTEPNNRKYTKQQDSNLNKVSRNLFRSVQLENTNENDVVDHQYANKVQALSFDESEEFVYTDYNTQEVSQNQTLPFVSRKSDNYPPNLSAPAYIYQQDFEQVKGEVYEEVTSFIESEEEKNVDKNDQGKENLFEKKEVEDLDDSETEMESYFQIKSPKHTSTPKLQQKKPVQKLGRIHAMNLLQKYQEVKTRPQRLNLATIEEKTSTDCWIREQKHNYEPECMTTLQCKSIAAELTDQVGTLASKASSTLRNLLKLHGNIINLFEYYKQNKSARQESTTRLLPLIQEYVQLLQSSTNNNTNNKKLNFSQILESSSTITNTINLSKLQKIYLELHKKSLSKNVEFFLEVLSDPKSEMDIRARITALTSLTLRNEELIPLLIYHGAIQIITAIIEKCEGSSVRGLGLRALTTLCINAKAIRNLESVTGLHTISDIICDNSRPEPERTEAIALLAQITAPWIEDNHNIQGLHSYSKRIVKYLTRYLIDAICCQNILLATAALSNLIAMDPKAIKYLLHQGTVAVLLDIIKNHKNIASVYILEQVATLIATMSSMPDARIALCDICAPVALICFLQTSYIDENVVIRLRQKTVIGLSRLCSEKEAAEQVVEAGGVEKLVQLCKEKPERFDNDAILVAALATLRKITEACGSDVMNAEDAQELIQPKLLDSFKAYATQIESLV